MSVQSLVDGPHRIVTFGTAPPRADVLASLGSVSFAHAGPAAHAPASAVPVDAPASDDPLDVLAFAVRAFPRETLVLVRSDASLPPLALPRLLRALEYDRVLGAAALDNVAPERSPMPGTVPADADSLRIDALCFAYGERRLIDASLGGAAVSAWHGERLAELGRASADDADALASHGVRCVLLDHLYVHAASPPRSAPAQDDPRDPAPPSPLAALRERIAAALESGATPDRPGLDARPVLLHVLHGWGGGAERWVRDFAQAFRGACHLVLVARGSFARGRHGEWLELLDGSLQGPPLMRVPLPAPIADTALADGAYRDILAGIVRDRCVDAVVVSSLIGHSLDALATRLPTFCVIHDHYPLWPTLHRDFGDAALRFDDAQRARDLAALGSDAEFANRNPKHWKALRDATVAAMRSAGATLIAPSRSALANELRLAPELAELAQHVVPHGLAPWPQRAPSAGERRGEQTSHPPFPLAGKQTSHSPLPLAGEGWGEGKPASPLRHADADARTARTRPRLLIPGRVRRGKGAELLVAALPKLREFADLYLVGAGADAHALFGERGVHIVLDYRRDELPAIVTRIAPDAALLLPTVAETFSYTLSELRSLGVPVIATRVGALAERIRDQVDGFLVEADAEAVTTRVAALLARRGALDTVRATLAAFTEPALDAMACAYADILRFGSRPAARYPLAWPDAASLRDADRARTIARLRDESRALRSDLDAARAESDRRGDWGHALDRQLGERTRWAQALDAELRDLKPRYEEVIASTSWRITAPLRRWNARLGGVRARIAFRVAHVRTTLARVRGSLAQRGVAATLARILAELRGTGPARARVAYPPPREDFDRFAVPASASPRVSIVVPVYNKIAYTSACLRSIAEHAGTTPFEVIAVDDGSSDRTQERLADVEGIRVLRNAENLGFIGSCNAGAAAAQGELVLFLNNDTQVTAGWLEALVRCLDEAPHAGLVGAKLIYPDGRLQEAGGIVFSDGSGWNYGRFDDPDDPRYTFRREADYCSGAAIVLRTELFRRLGGFDTRYAPAYYEDTDLAFAVRAAGYRVYVEPAATVVHFEGVTSGTDTTTGIKRFQPINREKFLDKWKLALARQPAPGTPIAIASSHRATKRILIVDATTPTPDQDSGSLRMVNLMRVLGDLGCRTSFLPDNRLWVERYTPALQAIGVEALYAPWNADPVKLFRERGAEFDAIVLSRHYIAASYVGLARLYAPRARLIFDTVDLHYLREQRAAELEGKPELARHAAATRAQELKLIRECDITLVVSEVEKALLAADAPGARVEVLSNVHEIYGCRKPFGERRDLVFVGGFQHPPNTDAVTWFVREVFPIVRAKLPDVKFHVIGSKVPASITALADEHVIVHGYVEDIAPYMDGCRVSVAPLRYGAGVKGKVNMAMSYGLPVVATPAAVEGMHVAPGADVLVAGDANAFADTVVRAYRDEALWHTLSERGLDNVRRHFSFDAAQAAVRRVLDF